MRVLLLNLPLQAAHVALARDVTLRRARPAELAVERVVVGVPAVPVGKQVRPRYWNYPFWTVTRLLVEELHGVTLPPSRHDDGGRKNEYAR